MNPGSSVFVSLVPPCFSALENSEPFDHYPLSLLINYFMAEILTSHSLFKIDCLFLSRIKVSYCIPCKSTCVCSVSQSCLTLCNAMDYNLPGSFVQGIFQARILKWLPSPFPRDVPNPGIFTKKYNPCKSLGETMHMMNY